MRKTPIRHHVKQHTRSRKPVHDYNRGKGAKSVSRVKITKRKINPKKKDNSFNMWPEESKEKKEEKTEPFDMWGKEGEEEDKLDMSIPDEEQFPKEKPENPDIPYYSRDDLEKMFIGDTEAIARETAKDLGFEFEVETMQGEVGEKTLEFRYPIDTDGVPGIQKPDAYREIDLTFDLSTEKVVNVHSFMSSVPEDRWGKTETEY